MGVTYAIESGYRELRMDVHVPQDATPDDPAPVVLWIHGGAWLFGARDRLPAGWPPGSVAQLLVDAGIAVASIDYRHLGELSFPAQLHDAKAALRYLRHFATSLALDSERIAVWGESAGGHLAALCALTTEPEFEGIVGVRTGATTVSAAVCFFPVTDLHTMPTGSEGMPEAVRRDLLALHGELPPSPIHILLDGSPLPVDETRRIASPTSHVRADAPPFLLAHGDRDTVVPVQQSELLASALTGVGASVELVVVPGAGHGFDGVDAAPQLARAVRFLSEHLRA
nr:alpha/beta hydrolase [Microbacterium bovistercoris]